MAKVKRNSNPETYLVGGAVRDHLLGIEPKERDWVVVGADPDYLLKQGFQQVGKEFPVFLHPNTKEEYALARTERKSGRGYHGFAVDFSSEVSLEEDLFRRDLTINAIAKSDQGELIDPYGGQADIKNRLLRHVSEHFTEDPLRLLRLARFYARFHHLQFEIAQETWALMQEIVDREELLELTPERIWIETLKALNGPQPHIYFQMLRDCRALVQIFPEIDQLFGVPNPVQWHPEVDTGIHTLMVLDQAAQLSPLAEVRFAALCHDLGKGLTPKALWPKHQGHEHAGIKPIKNLCKRLKIPNSFRDLACLGSEFHLHAHKARELRPQTLLKVLKAFDFFRRPERFEHFLDICEADFRGRTGFETRDYPQRHYFEHIAYEVRKYRLDPEALQSLQGKARGEKIDQGRIAAIKAAINAYPD